MPMSASSYLGVAPFLPKPFQLFLILQLFSALSLSSPVISPSPAPSPALVFHAFHGVALYSLCERTLNIPIFNDNVMVQVLLDMTSNQDEYIKGLILNCEQQNNAKLPGKYCASMAYHVKEWLNVLVLHDVNESCFSRDDLSPAPPPSPSPLYPPSSLEKTTAVTLAMTSISWRSPSLASHCQTHLSAALAEALLSHPSLVSSIKDASYVFLDAETANERGWTPYLDKLDQSVNTVNTEPGQKHETLAWSKGNLSSCYLTHSLHEDVIHFLREHLPLRKNQTLVLFDNRSSPSVRPISDDSLIVAGVSLSESAGTFRPGLDIAVPPPPLRELSHLFSPSCSAASLPLLATLDCVDTHAVRQRLALAALGEPDIHVSIKCREWYDGTPGNEAPPPGLCEHDIADVADDAGDKDDWMKRLSRSVFGYVPRGHGLFTYRLAEVMSAGAIPVVISDGWELPFSEIVDWKTISIQVGEEEVEGVVERLRGVGWEERCEMRRRGREFYDRYMRTPGGIVDGVVQILEEREAAVRCTDALACSDVHN